MPDIRDLGHIGQWLAEIGQEIWQRPCRSHRQAVLIVHIRRTNRHTGPFWICYGVCSCGTMTCLVLGVEVWTRPFWALYSMCYFMVSVAGCCIHLYIYIYFFFHGISFHFFNNLFTYVSISGCSSWFSMLRNLVSLDRHWDSQPAVGGGFGRQAVSSCGSRGQPSHRNIRDSEKSRWKLYTIFIYNIYHIISYHTRYHIYIHMICVILYI